MFCWIKIKICLKISILVWKQFFCACAWIQFPLLTWSCYAPLVWLQNYLKCIKYIFFVQNSFTEKLEDTFYFIVHSFKKFFKKCWIFYFLGFKGRHTWKKKCFFSSRTTKRVKLAEPIKKISKIKKITRTSWNIRNMC